jgi:hypothetical protein
MRSLALHAAVASLLLQPTLARAETRASTTPLAMVRGYFEAIGHNDFGRALSLTAGSAQASTLSMWQELRQQAKAHSARLELKVRELHMAQRPPAGSTVPVDVKFDIDVVGHKWMFSRVARKLAGTAQFIVEPQQQRRIVAIQGTLD